LGKTIVIFKITPKEDQIDNAIADLKKIKKGIVKDVQKFPIGFGIEILKAAILIEEKADTALAELEQEISSIESIENSEVENMTLL